MSEELPLFPVVGWDIGTVPSLHVLFIRIAFLSHETQKPEQADPGRNYALTPAQARALVDALGGALQKLQSAGPQGQGWPKH